MNLKELKQELQPEFDTVAYRAINAEIAALQVKAQEMAKATFTRVEVEFKNGHRGIVEFYHEQVSSLNSGGRFYRYKKDGTLSKYSTYVMLDAEVVSYKKL